MDGDHSLEMAEDWRVRHWLYLLQQREERIPEWAAQFHPQKLSCSLQEDPRCGSFNFCRKLVFTSGEAWMIRFPIDGRTSTAYADEKVASEVATLKLIREQTDIPVPEVKAWGLGCNNPLGLGPFIMYEFVPGLKLSDVLAVSEPGTNILREDVGDDELRVVYRQFAQFLLQLFRLDFPRIGSLPTESTFLRPLTLKAHEIVRLGGVDVFGRRGDGFSTTADYFRYVVEQDWQQLLRQKNAAFSEWDAEEKYVFIMVLKSLVDRHVWPEHQTGPSKLICDDFGPSNVIVNNAKDLQIVAVVDLEWSYVGPAQLLGTAPWWLLQERPHNWSDSADRRARFLEHLDMFKRVLGEEEEKGPPAGPGESLSAMVRRSEERGTMWFHMVLQSFFLDPDSFPCAQLRAETPDWDELAAAIPKRDIQSFVAKKMAQRKEHDRMEEWAKATRDDMREGKMTVPEFIEKIEARFRTPNSPLP